MSHTKSSLNDILEGVGVQNAFNDLMSLWILPEIEERRRNRRIPQNFIFDIAKVILQSDEKGVVRSNEEVIALSKAKRKAGIKKAYNELVYEDEIEGILDFHLEITIIQTRVMSHSCNSKING